MTKKNRHFVAFGPSAEIIIAFLLSCLWLGAITLAQEPTLPAGLEAEEETETSGPTLPSGLDDESAEPSLPTGLQEAPSPSAEPPQRPAGGDLLKTFRQLGLSGFWEVRGGVRTQNDPHQEQASLGETRLQLDFERILQDVTIKLVADVLYDAVFDHLSVDLERGKGWLDLRQASFSTSPLKFMDIKVGRQILTWGTGDMVFLNDLFPKDWQAFLIGRDVEYLKAPSDAMKVGLYSELANL
ncbi:MAG: hypothetical protein HQ546_05025, partial [Planctomycetes bacterium]|nr:hypothetical protein [Planctomycetota bacterium]